LMEVCRLRDTPIFTFINKMDREDRPPLDVLDEIEEVLGIDCAPVTWPIGMSAHFKGVYHLIDDTVHLYKGADDQAQVIDVSGPEDSQLAAIAGADLDTLREEIDLIRAAGHDFDAQRYLDGKLTPVFFRSAVTSFGIRPLLHACVEHARATRRRAIRTREVVAGEKALSGFVFKIQSNMDRQHRDRIAFMRVCSGHYHKGMKMRHLRTGKEMRVNDAITFMANKRDATEDAWPGDIIGILNHGSIAIGVCL